MKNVCKKVFLRTINDFNNYGNRLQNYAIFSILKSHGVETVYDDIIFSKEEWVNNSNGIKRIIKAIVPFSVWKRKICKSISVSKDKERYENFKAFSELYHKIGAPIFFRNNNEITKKYGKDAIYITGSDQVWNPYLFPSLFMNLLGFAEGCTKVALAPSISVDSLNPHHEREFKRYLSSFKYLSCREQQGADLISKITGRDCAAIIDPTLMLSANDWDKVAIKPKFHNINKRYLLLYFLGNLTNEYRKIIINISQKYNLEVIDIYDKNSDYYSCGPSEFIWMIKHCTIMLTDSFHGSIFSYIYDRPFRIFKRIDASVSMNSRLVNLIQILGLSDDIYVNSHLNLETILQTNYKKNFLVSEQEKFQNYLKEALCQDE